MKRCLFFLLVIVATRTWGQVDVEHRRTLFVQTSAAVHQGEESLGGFGYFWFNENQFPWTNTALRVIYAGVFADAEFSWFLPAATNTAIGAGAGGGLFLENLTPYLAGERLTDQSFDGDSANFRVFLNQTIPNPTPLPINVRGTYALSGAFYRRNSSTSGYVVPNDILVQSVTVELRLGGIEPGLTATRGAELYVAGDANFRSGARAFGPVGSPFPVEQDFERLFASLSGKIPIRRTILFARVAGGMGGGIDQLSAWKIGGNLIGVEPVGYTLHGYYFREFFARNFGLANLDWAVPLNERRTVAVHLYGDWAAIKPPAPEAQEWSHYFGVGAGLAFPGFWKTTCLVSYGYGINAVRNGSDGGHEVAFALEKQF